MDIIDELNTFFPDLNNFEYVYDDIFP